MDLIDETFKTTIKIAKENDLIKIHHLSLDGTKIKAKTSINKLTYEDQIKIMKEHLKKVLNLINKKMKNLEMDLEIPFLNH